MRLVLILKQYNDPDRTAFGLQRYYLFGSSAIFFDRRYDDGDVGGAGFFADPRYSAQDFFEVTALDTINRQISGRYDVHLTDSLDFVPHPSLTYVHFVDGIFDLKY